MRHITIVGNLTADPSDTRKVGDNEVADFKVATNGRDENDVIFFKCVVWNKRIAGLKYLHKGDQVTVTGRLYDDSWDGNEGRVFQLAIDVADYSLPPKKKDGDREDRSRGREEPAGRWR